MFVSQQPNQISSVPPELVGDNSVKLLVGVKGNSKSTSRPCGSSVVHIC